MGRYAVKSASAAIAKTQMKRCMQTTNRREIKGVNVANPNALKIIANVSKKETNVLPNADVPIAKI